MVFKTLIKDNHEVPNITYAEWILQLYRKRASEGRNVLVWADRGTEISYADLLRYSIRAATAFQSMGAKSGDTMSVVSKNSPELYACVIGCFFADIKVAPSVYELSASELRSNFEIVKPRFILTRPEKASVIQDAISDLNPRPEVILLDEETFAEILEKGSHASVDTFEPMPREDPQAHVFAYLFSSGTTGKQKAIKINDYKFVRGALFGSAAFCNRTGLYLCASQISWISWFHFLTRSAFADRPWVFTTATDIDSIMQFIHKYKPTSYLCPPSMIYAVRDQVAKQPGRWDISSVKEILTGGDRFGEEVQRELSEQLKINIYQEYGSTEIGVITTPDMSKGPIYGSVGRIVAPIKLVDPESEQEITATNTVGELRIKVIHMAGYVRNAQATAEAFDSDGWFKTGDLVYLDDKTNVFIVDRIKEMLKYKGFQVAPRELEDIIRMVPGVSDAAVVGKNDLIAGSLITAFVVKRTGANVTEMDIKNFMAKQNLHDAKQLRGGVIFIDELPKTSSGKILRRKLAEVLNGTQTPKSVAC